MDPHLFLALIREIQLFCLKAILVLMGLAVAGTIVVLVLRGLGYAV